MGDAGALGFLISAYRAVRAVAVVLWPTMLLAYLLSIGGNLLVEGNHHLHSALVGVILIGTCASAGVALACYRRTREPILRYLVVGFTAMGTTFALHGILGELGMGDMGSGHGALMLQLGGEARTVMVFALAFAFFQWKSPPDSADRKVQISLFLGPCVAALAIETVVLVVAQLDQVSEFGRLCEITSLTVGILSVIFVVLRNPMNQSLFRALTAMALFMQSSLCFLSGGPWSHVWWLGHVLFGIGAMVLGYATVLSYTTEQTFVSAKSEGEILELMRRAETALSEAERATAAKSRFMAAASHDLRQPLVPIKLFAELLEVEVREPAQASLVQKLRGAIQSLDDLLGKMLDFSRVESGTVQPRPERVRLGEVLSRFHEEFSPVAAEKGLELRYVPTSALVRTDRILLEQVLRNLIENAIRYTAEGGIVLGCRRRGDMVAVSVIDSGQGISADQRVAVFTEYYQAEPYNHDRRLGMGLGLATVDRLCRLLSHPVELDSVPGLGSRFTVLLPRATERRVKPRIVEVKQLSDPGALRVLVLDDDPDVRDGVVTAILRRGWEPVVAANCREAVEAVMADGLPDVIVTDLRVEADLCGLDALAQIEALGLGPVSAVIITGDASHHRLAEAMNGPWRVLVKPFAVEHLYSAITEAYLRSDQRELASVG